MNKEIYNYCLRLLSKREYSRSKLNSKLLSKSYLPDEISIVIEMLIDKKFLNEERYTEGRIKQLLNRRYSNQYILFKCDKENLQTTGEQIESLRKEYHILEVDSIDSLVQKKIQSLAKKRLDNNKIKNKVLYFLQSKGYSYSHCVPYLSKYLENASDNENNDKL